MHRSIRILLAAVLAGLPVAAAVTFAQEGPAQTFTSADGSFSFDYPAGWIVITSDNILFANTPDAFEGGLSIQPGQVGGILFDPALLSNLMQGVSSPAGGDPVSVLSLIVSQYGINAPGDPVPVTLADHPAARLDLFAVDGMDGLVIVLDLGGGVYAGLLALSVTGEMPRFEPDLLAMLDSMTYRAAPNLLLASFDVPEGDVTALAVSPDGRWLASGSSSGTVRLWDTVSSSVSDPLTYHGDVVIDLAFSPDGTRLVSGSSDGSLAIWSVADSRLVMSLAGHTAGVNGVAFSPDGQRVISGSRDGTQITWDVATGQQVVSFSGYSDTTFYFSPDGTQVATVSLSPTTGYGDSVDVASVGDPYNDYAFIQVPTDWISDVAFSPDNRVIATADGDVQLWDAATGAAVATLSGGGAAEVEAVTFDDQGSLLAAGMGTQILIWDVNARQLKTALRGYQGSICCVVFSRSGTLLVSGDDKGTLKLWDLSSITGETQKVITIPDQWEYQEARDYTLMGRSYRVRFYFLFEPPVPVFIPVPVRVEGENEVPISDPDELTAVAYYAAWDLHQSGYFTIDWEHQAATWQDFANQYDPKLIGGVAQFFLIGGDLLLDTGLDLLLTQIFPQGAPTQLAALASKVNRINQVISIGNDLLKAIDTLFFTRLEDNDLRAVIQATIDLDPETKTTFSQQFDVMDYLKRGSSLAANSSKAFGYVVEGMDKITQEIPVYDVVEVTTDSGTEMFAEYAGETQVIKLNMASLVSLSTLVPKIAIHVGVESQMNDIEQTGQLFQCWLISNQYHATALVALANAIQADLNRMQQPDVTPAELMMLIGRSSRLTFDFYYVLYEMQYVSQSYLQQVDALRYGNLTVSEETLESAANNVSMTQDFLDHTVTSIHSIDHDFSYFVTLSYPDFAASKP